MPVLLRVRPRRIRVRPSTFKALAQKLLKTVGESRAELSVELVGDRRMRGLNRRYRGRDYSTDVLAFPMRRAPRVNRLGLSRKALGGSASRSMPDAVRPSMIGDVVISLPTAERQAARRGRSVDHEVATLLIHGVLHLCGYDHERGEKEARRMRRKERAVWKALQPIPKLIARR
ncbi:MAG: rRNA maturation RNase YbeY [Nitrospirota bacterium]